MDAYVCDKQESSCYQALTPLIAGLELMNKVYHRRDECIYLRPKILQIRQ